MIDAESGLLVGEQIRALRLSRGLSMGALARLAGVRDSTLSRWESGKRHPLIPELEAVLEAVGADRAARRDILLRLEAPRALVRLRNLQAAGAPPIGGDLLQSLRLRKGWTQAEAARALDVAQSQIARWERGDSWPTTQKLHALCWHLGADADELTELSTSKSGQLTFGNCAATGEPDLPRAGEELSEAAAKPWFTYVSQHLSAPRAPFVLSLFRLQNRLSLLASNYPVAERLLPNACAIQARHHMQLTEVRQAETAAARGIALARSQRSALGTSYPLWFGNVVVMAAITARTGTPAGLRRAIQVLVEWLPAVRHCPSHYSWGRSDLASYLARLGRFDEAVSMSASVCRQVAQKLPGEYAFRLHDHAHVLCQAGQPAEALRVLEESREAARNTNDTSFFFSVRQELLEAQCLTSLHNTAAADERLRAAELIVSKQPSDPRRADFVRETARIGKAARH